MLEINIISAMEVEIKKYNTSLKKRLGYDEIISTILKTCSSSISIPLSHLCNHSVQIFFLTDWLKISIVKPIYKGDKFCMTDYAAVSLLTMKLCVFMCNRLNHLNHTNNISVPAKFSLRKGIFTEKSIFMLIDYLKPLTKECM